MRTVLVSGAARGLGLATSLALAEKGFAVWSGVRQSDDIDRVESAARARGLKLRAVALDIANNASIDAAVGQIESETGPLYGIVNNAAVTMRGYFEDVADDEMRNVFEVNVFGTMALVRRALPAMRAAGRGRIIVLSSVAGRIGAMGLSPYVSTKFALEGFAESLALELRPFGLQVSLIEPGIVKTDIWGANNRVAAAARDPRSPYFDYFSRVLEVSDKIVRASRLTPEKVAATVARALTEKTPRLRYNLGMPARLLISLRRHLPGEMFERIYFGRLCQMVARRSRPGDASAAAMAGARPSLLESRDDK